MGKLHHKLKQHVALLTLFALDKKLSYCIIHPLFGKL
jgi:hypothetical protein